MNKNKQKRMEAFLSGSHLARLATASLAGQPHVVPVWFLWEDGAAWISAYGSTRKVKELLVNSKCALVVDVTKSEHGLTGVLMEGEAELLSGYDAQVREQIKRIYLKYLGEEGVLGKEPQEWLKSPENTLIKLIPTKIRTW
jgi:nitroimidazol reductase NimA-like FMN-containing flavoprotein (pyridoxamine 5'-phosphate oxidase superfamily)